MKNQSVAPALVLGVLLCAGLIGMGVTLGNAALDYREYERTVRVKGLAERELPADVVIWPIQFAEASNDLTSLHVALENGAGKVRQFLLGKGIEAAEISLAAPAITDKSAQSYGGPPSEFRYTGTQTVTVYSSQIQRVRDAMSALSELGKQGVAVTGGDYQSQTEYLFTRLNDIKPEMIEEATTKAREVAEKFAADSNSRLGKIRTASQGQFTISDRDRNNPHIKNIRVVSTVEYYLSD